MCIRDRFQLPNARATSLTISWSAPHTKPMTADTKTMTTEVYVVSSCRVGRTTLRSSSRIWPTNRPMAPKKRPTGLPLWGAPRRARSELAAPAVLVSVISRALRLCRIEPCRAGGTRTPNRRFWRPVLYQLSHCPMRDALGALVRVGARISLHMWVPGGLGACLSMVVVNHPVGEHTRGQQANANSASSASDQPADPSSTVYRRLRTLSRDRAHPPHPCLPPSRLHRRVSHPCRRRQSQGAQGQWPSRHRLR